MVFEANFELAFGYVVFRKVIAAGSKCKEMVDKPEHIVHGFYAGKGSIIGAQRGYVFSRAVYSWKSLFGHTNVREGLIVFQ